MLTIKTYLAPSKIHGIGLFSVEDVPSKTVVWKFHPFVDKVMSSPDFFRICQDVDECALQHLLHSTYKRGNQFFYLSDNARFINHSAQRSNITFSDDYSEVAARPIKAGEELLEDYSLSYDANDFFFTEHLNTDPQSYLVREGVSCHA